MPFSCSNTSSTMHRNNQRPNQLSPIQPNAAPPIQTTTTHKAAHARACTPFSHSQNAPEPYDIAAPSPELTLGNKVRQTRANDAADTTRHPAEAGDPSCPARPGAHQNQIHLSKDQLPAPNTPMPRHTTATRNPNGTETQHHPRQQPEYATRTAQRPGGGRDRTDDPLLAKQVLSQLSYAPTDRRVSSPGPSPGPFFLGQGGFEPPTPRLSSVCSNQLSY